MLNLSGRGVGGRTLNRVSDGSNGVKVKSRTSWREVYELKQIMWDKVLLFTIHLQWTLESYQVCFCFWLILPLAMTSVNRNLKIWILRILAKHWPGWAELISHYGGNVYRQIEAIEVKAPRHTIEQRPYYSHSPQMHQSCQRTTSMANSYSKGYKDDESFYLFGMRLVFSLDGMSWNQLTWIFGL